MKKICVSMKNRVFAESIMFMLERTGDFTPVRIVSDPPGEVIAECESEKPDIVFFDVTPTSAQTDCGGRLELVNELKKSVPDCKIAVFCDETAYPDQAREVIRAKQTGKIDAFFYASVTAEYLTAALDSI